MADFRGIQKHLFIVVSLFFMAGFLGCGGGGGGGGNDAALAASNEAGGDPLFYLEEIFFSRPIFGAAGELRQILNPSSLVETDPITGLFSSDPEPLIPGDDINKLAPFNLQDTSSSPFKVKILPRNSVIVLQFSQGVDWNSLRLDENSFLTDLSPIEILTAQGNPVPIQVVTDTKELFGLDKVILNPIVEEKLGFPASPIAFDLSGSPVGNPEGFLKIHIYSAGTGKSPVKSLVGSLLSSRGDLLGTPVKPIGFNPGNSQLDFAEYGEISFNGFLPDLSPPRIIREVRDLGTIETVDLSSQGYILTVSSKDYVTEANQGEGEWSGALFSLQPADRGAGRVIPRTESGFYDPDKVVVKWESGDLPVAGDPYLVKRAEYFEPIPGMDPSTAVEPEPINGSGKGHPKDPLDPEDYNNWNINNFVTFQEPTQLADGSWHWVEQDFDIGENGNNPIKHSWRLSLLFSEPMAVDSFRPYETFYVCEASVDIREPGFRKMRPGRATGSNKNRLISFEPMLDDQVWDTDGRFIGFGGQPKSLRLVLRVVPSYKQIEDFYASLGPDPVAWPPVVVGDLKKAGVLGIIDLGGQPLGLPAAFLNKGSPYAVTRDESPGAGVYPPAADLKFEFNIKPEEDPDAHPESGVLVHRFMGLPKTGVGLDGNTTGVIFRDLEGQIYGPHIADTSLGLNGFLSGHPVEFIEHVFDDHNNPPPSAPHYPDPIFKIPFGTGTPVNAPLGCRFQHVYRTGDVSPDVAAFAGTKLDLIGMAWAPIGGWVNDTLIEKLSIGISNSDVVPRTNQSAGIPGLNVAESGLDQEFSANIADEQVFVVGSETNGVPYSITWRNIFGPKNQGKQFNNYLPWPDFARSFGYTSEKSLLIEYRTDPNELTGVDGNNGFSYHAGIISSMLPRFRIYTRGDDLTAGGINGPVHGATQSGLWATATGPLATPGVYGDNSRYFMIFNYVKRHSFVSSPFLGLDTLDVGYDMVLLNPVIIPPLTELPEGTALDLKFQTTPNPDPLLFDPSPFLKGPAEVEDLNINTATLSHNYIRFQATFEANVEAGSLPLLDTVIIPYRIEKL